MRRQGWTRLRVSLVVVFACIAPHPSSARKHKGPISSPPPVPVGYYGPLDPNEPVVVNPFDDDAAAAAAGDQRPVAHRSGRHKKYAQRASSAAAHQHQVGWITSGDEDSGDEQAPFGGVPVNETEALRGYTYGDDSGGVGVEHMIHVENASFPTAEMLASRVEAAEARERKKVEEEEEAAALLDAEAQDGFMKKVILGIVVIVSAFVYLMYKDHARSEKMKAGRGTELEQRMHRAGTAGVQPPPPPRKL